MRGFGVAWCFSLSAGSSAQDRCKPPDTGAHWRATGAQESTEGWGLERPLGQIASKVYRGGRSCSGPEPRSARGVHVWPVPGPQRTVQPSHLRRPPEQCHFWPKVPLREAKSLEAECMGSSILGHGVRVGLAPITRFPGVMRAPKVRRTNPSIRIQDLRDELAGRPLSGTRDGSKPASGRASTPFVLAVPISMPSRC